MPFTLPCGSRTRRALLCLLFLPGAATADESAAGAEWRSRQDIDFATTALGARGILTTRAGRFDCRIRNDRGETRIDAFDNIFGIDSVRDAPWQNWTAEHLGCRYGARMKLASGTLTAGAGYTSYDGRTPELPGGKAIKASGGGLHLDYRRHENRLTFDWRQKAPRLHYRHATYFGNYESFIDVNEQTLRLRGRNRHFRFQADQTAGDKSNRYSHPLFPANRFDYRYNRLAAGPRFHLSDGGEWFLAPRLATGSRRGSFNPLTTATTFNGLLIGYQYRDWHVRLDAERFDGEGERPYLPATDRLHERLQSDRYRLNLTYRNWDLSLENHRFTHRGNVTVIDPVYQLIVGGAGPYTNRRIEDRWELAIDHRLTRGVQIGFSLYFAQRSDRQYNLPVHEYTENGGHLSVSLPLSL